VKVCGKKIIFTAEGVEVAEKEAVFPGNSLARLGAESYNTRPDPGFVPGSWLKKFLKVAGDH
jgi:hypothetical protein